MPWKAYDLPPIDWSWEYLPTVEEMAKRFAADDAVLGLQGAPEYEPRMLPDFMRHFEMAKEMATEVGWEGDWKSYAKPRVFFLPGETNFEYAFAWKQDNNGTTFVISPQPLPWLDQRI